MQIADREISADMPPYIIAEMSGNHNASLDRALEIVDAAAECGVDALKLQTYTADTITLDVGEADFSINDKDSLWYGKRLHELYDKAHTPWEWHEAIFQRAKDHGLACFSSPFDETAVDFLESLDVPAYKIASFENVHLPLIRKVAATGKPLIISTGMASLAELDEAVQAARQAGCTQLALLKCTSTYPATPENSNLSTIPHIRQLFDCEIGLSDHTMGVGVPVAATALGATVIEKHFTLKRSDGGVDSAFSLEPDEMRDVVIETKRAWQAIGTVTYGPTEAEQKSLEFRRSIYVAKDLRKGDVLDETNLRCVRPGLGLPTKYWDLLLGMTARKDAVAGSPMDWGIVTEEKTSLTEPL